MAPVTEVEASAVTLRRHVTPEGSATKHAVDVDVHYCTPFVVRRFNC
jgi:hypothetical protein